MESYQFEVNFVQASDEGVVVSGRNCGASIRIGQVFDWVYRGTVVRDSEGNSLGMRRFHERPILLKVTAIEVYRRWSDELSEGMTGRLFLRGIGGETLCAFDFLTARNLGTHGHSTHTI